jgi:hypothetical protein
MGRGKSKKSLADLAEARKAIEDKEKAILDGHKQDLGLDLLALYRAGLFDPEVGDETLRDRLADLDDYVDGRATSSREKQFKKAQNAPATKPEKNHQMEKVSAPERNPEKKRGRGVFEVGPEQMLSDDA